MTTEPDEEHSWIAGERTGPGRPHWWFWAATTVLGVVTTFILVGLIRPDAPLRVAEVAYLRDNGLPLAVLYRSLDITWARILASVFSGLAVAAAALVARRLSHSDVVGVVAATLFALDPLLLAEGHLALPHSFLLATGLFALVAFLSSRGAMHWVGAAFLSLAAMTDLGVLVWGGALAAVSLLRGHIYAAPKHLGQSALQAVVVPGAVGAIFHVVAFIGRFQPVADCMSLPRWDVLILRSTLHFGGGLFGIHNPATWFAGIGALLFLFGTAIYHVGREFRVARLPGRVQLRLNSRLPRIHGRTFWLVLLVVAAPTTFWMPLLAIALTLAVQELSRDARVFGFVIYAAAIGFAVAYVARLWLVVQGGGDMAALQDLGEVVPWGRTVTCAG